MPGTTTDHREERADLSTQQASSEYCNALRELFLNPLHIVIPSVLPTGTNSLIIMQKVPYHAEVYPPEPSNIAPDSSTC